MLSNKLTDLNLVKSMLVGSLHQDGHGLRVLALLDEGELVLPEDVLVHGASITKTALIYTKKIMIKVYRSISGILNLNGTWKENEEADFVVYSQLLFSYF